MKNLLLSLFALSVASVSHGALAELNVAEGSILTPDGAFSGRDFTMVNGFKLELLYKTNIPTEGQWVALGWDSKGRLLAPSYNSDRLARVTVPKVGSNDPVKVEMITSTPVAAAEGVLEAFGGLYIDANRSMTMRSGMYKLTDTNNDDKYDKTTVIRNRQGAGDHGTHTLQLSPDKQWITMISGNATNPTDLTGSKVPQIWGEDNLVMRMDLSPPGFHRAPEANIVYLNQDASKVELWNMGMRNPVSHAFNKDGELFVYDADEEPNMGFTVGYRPTDIIHAISGADAGWRAGSKVHPYHYFDNYGPIGVVGSGSPVGSTFGTGAKFPARYQDAFFIADWSFGNLWATFITPSGSGYKAEPMPFVSGRPFPVSGIAVNPADGSLIVMTTGTELYRVTYVGNESTEATKRDETFAAARDQRHKLEAFHGVKNPSAVATAWPFLSDPDRATRFAARTAIEHQDVASWRERAINEVEPRRAIAAIASLARASGPDEYHIAPGTQPNRDKALQNRMLGTLDRIEWNSLAYQDKLDLVRAYQLVMIRLGKPDAAATQRLAAKFDPKIPGPEDELNRMVAEVLAYLQAPTAATKLLALLREPPVAPHYGIQEWINPQQRVRQDRGEVTGPNRGYSQQQLAKQDNEIYYAQLLRTVTAGWTPELRRQYMDYFVNAPKTYVGNLPGLLNIRADAIAMIPENERGPVQALIDTPMPMGNPFNRQGGPAPAVTVQSSLEQRTGRGTPGLALPAINLYVQPGGANRAFNDIEITAMSRFDEGILPQLRAQQDASTALTQASLTAPTTIAAKAAALAEAELALALVRAERFGRIKTDLKITPERMPAFAQAMSTRGGGGRGGAARGAAAPAAPAARGAQ